MKTILVTGSEGFVGSHLIMALKESLDKIVATAYPLAIPKDGFYVPLDIMNLEMTKEVFKEYQPDTVFHLAAISSVSKSLRDPPLAYNTNFMGTVNLLEAARNIKKRIKFIFVSTCELYGGGEDILETAPITLKNPYAVSKYAAELACQNYEASGIDIMILRPFTHTGPGQSKDFVLPSVISQIVEIEKGTKPPLIELGNIDSKREFMNIQDITGAYKLAITMGKTGSIYNISSNKGYTINEALSVLRDLSRTKFEIKIDPSKIRKVDIKALIGNGNKFSKLTKWQPKFTFEKTLEDLLNFWRAKT
jgi:GDP-4-dehydro-6-deoxy-D-mannose reductase